MEKSLYRFTLVIGILAASRTVTTVSSTASTSSSTLESETTTNGDAMYNSTPFVDFISTTDDIDTTLADFTKSLSNSPTSEITSTESDTTQGDPSTTTAAPTKTVDELTTTTDFTTSVNIDSSTTEIETTTANEQTTTDSATQFTDLTTSVASETTTTVSILSTTAGKLSTSVDIDTTPVTSTQSDTTTPISEGETTARNMNVTAGYLCQTTESFANDDVRNYAIIALSIALGILSISVIILCVISRIFGNVKKSKVSTGTQTDFFISREIYVRPLPPIDTFMKKEKSSISSNRNLCFTEKSPKDIYVDIISEHPLGDTKIDIFSDRQCDKENGKQRKDCNGHDEINSRIILEPTATSCRSDADTHSVISNDTNVSSDDMDKTHIEEFFHGDSRCLYPEGVYPDSMTSESELLFLASETDSSSFDQIKEEREIDMGNEKIFAHIASVSGLGEASEVPTKSKTDTVRVSLENRRPSFKIKHCTDNEDDVEDIITLNTDETTPAVRHVTFQEPREQNMRCKSNRIEAVQGDHVVTLTSPKFRTLPSTETNGNTTKTNRIKPNNNRKRKRVRKLKEFDRDVDKVVPLSHALNRYRSSYDIISRACFKLEIKENEKMEHLRQLETRKRLKLKAKCRIKMKTSKPKPEPKFQSEPYHSLYSRLSHFENE